MPDLCRERHLTFNYQLQEVPMKKAPDGITIQDSGSGRRLRSFAYNARIAPYVFVAPFVIVFLVFYVYPIISGFVMSFQNVVPGQTKFVGWKNYKILTNREFKKAIRNSVVYTVMTLATLLPIPMFLAVLLNSRKMVAKSFFRSILFLPALVSVVVGGFTFRLIFGELPTSLLNSVTGKFGIEAIKWLGGPKQWTTYLALLVLAIWRWLGVNIIYYLSGLQNIPDELYESADIDGATGWQKFTKITMPLLKPTTIYVLTISIYGGLAMFLESYMLFNGNNSPNNSGLTIVGFLYKVGWQQNKYGYASAVGICLLLATLVINLIQLKATGFFEKE